MTAGATSRFRTEGARGTSHESLRPNEIAERAIAMPRSASAGASSRKATRFNAPRGSPAASACAAAVISESKDRSNCRVVSARDRLCRRQTDRDSDCQARPYANLILLCRNHHKVIDAQEGEES
jgi:hypothetical protein